MLRSLSLLLACVLLASGCDNPSKPATPGDVKGKDLSYDDPSSRFSIDYPSKWGDAVKESGQGVTLTTDPVLTVGVVQADAPKNAASLVVEGGVPVGEPRTGDDDGIETWSGFFDTSGDSSDRVYLRLVRRTPDEWVYATLRDSVADFERSKAGYVKVVDGLEPGTVEANPAVQDDEVVEISDESKAEAEKLAKYLLNQKEPDSVDELAVGPPTRETIFRASYVFSMAQLCGLRWEEPLKRWMDQAFSKFEGDQDAHARALMGGANQVILTGLKAEDDTCDDAKRAAAERQLEALVQ